MTLWRWSHQVLIENNVFHDCLGCDFVHGRFGTHLTIRGNRFDRSLPCSMGRYRCGHQDLVQLFAGRHLLVTRNHFGLYREGGAQLYLTNNLDYATVVNNVFVGTDPRVPGYHARMGIVIGSNASRRLPWYAKVINNTILTGARRRDGYAGSLRMSSRYGGVQRWKRPIVANNVIALLETPGRVCLAAQRFIQNVVIQGKTCSDYNLVGPADLDVSGRPRADSSVIDVANRHYAPATDATGRPRGPRARHRGDRIPQPLSSTVSAAQVRAFRLARHHLTDPLPAERLTEVVAAVGGVQAQVMSAAELAIWARSEGLSLAQVPESLWERRELVKTWCMRGTLHLLAAADWPVWAAALSQRAAVAARRPGCAGSASRSRRWRT